MGSSNWFVQGVAELNCWLSHRQSTWPSGRDAEDLIDEHVAHGMRNIAWKLGRSVLTYHSDLPGATCYGLGRHYDRFYPEARAQIKARMNVYRERCQLRVALTYGAQQGCTIYGRLCMNRHYSPESLNRSEFANNNPKWAEIGRDGWLDASRLCYAIPEYRAERVAILAEAARIGCDGLVLDFCRQPPAVRYHPAFVNEYRTRTGHDARTLTLADRDAFLDWCRFRASYVTEFLRELKAALDPFRERYDRVVPVQVRIPNDGLEANLIAGFDVETWCADGLIDEIALSELQWLSGYYDWDDRPYIALGHRHGLKVLGNANCLPVQRDGWSGQINPRGINPLVLSKRVLAGMENGADGLSFYQSDTAVFLPGVRDALHAWHDEAALRAYVDDPANADAYPVTDANREYGIDNHSHSMEHMKRIEAQGPDGVWV